jgi:hypothetical protein
MEEASCGKWRVEGGGWRVEGGGWRVEADIDGGSILLLWRWINFQTHPQKINL